MVRGLSKAGVVRLAEQGLASGAILYVSYNTQEERNQAAKVAFDKGQPRLYDLILDQNVIAYHFDDVSEAYSMAKAIRKKTKILSQVYPAGSV